MPRKEVNLSNKTITKLQRLAEKDKRKLKPYMEKVLDEHATNPNPNEKNDSGRNDRKK